jgi:DivIVA domain-containing protein
MPLTPEDVRNKRFTPVRLREGYDMGEVDQFLDEVEAELERLTQENNDLRSKLTAASSARPEPAAQPTPEPVKRVETPAPPPPTPVPAPAVVAPPAATPQSPAESQPTAPITTVSQASGAAARLLELATRNADEVVADAHDQSDKILAEARTKAERMENEARTKADRMESDARARAQKLDSETAERRQQLFGDLEKDRDRLAREVEHLRSFEREYRSRLKNYFASQLSQLDGDETMATAALPGGEPEHTPKRLRSLLGEDDQQQQQ